MAECLSCLTADDDSLLMVKEKPKKTNKKDLLAVVAAKGYPVEKLHKLSVGQLLTFISGVENRESWVGNYVKRNTNEGGYGDEVGIVLESTPDRFWVQWPNCRTWYLRKNLYGVMRP